jgi:lysozyme
VGACSDPSAQGSTWLHIVAVGGNPTSLLFGVADVYAIPAAFASVSGGPSATPAPTPTPLGPTLEGIDVSYHEGTIDWSAVVNAGIRFAWIKATEGTKYVDPAWATNSANARAAGMPFGAFHYAQPGTDPGLAAEQADHFVDVAGFGSGNLLPVLDVEITNGLTPSAMQTFIAQFLDRVLQRTGIHAVIYTSPNFWRKNVGDTAVFAQNGYNLLWVAHWTTASAPSMPASNWGGFGWTVWQYTDKGTVPGITKVVDRDRLAGTDLSRILIP